MKSEVALKNIEIPVEVLECNLASCQNDNHRTAISGFLSSIVGALQSSSETKEFSERNYIHIPGWNDFVKEFHREARGDYLSWREQGKPREGLLFDRMNLSKSQFKRMIRFCKENEEKIISNKIASGLRGNRKKIWK